MPASIIVWILIFILPFLIFPIGISEFEAPKIYAAELGIIILSLLGIFASYKNLLKEKIPLILFSLLFLLSLFHLLSHMTPTAFLGNIFRQQGIFLLWLLMLFSFFSAYLSRIKIPPIIITLLVAIEFILSVFIIRPLDDRAVGTLGEPNALAGFVAFLWPFIAFKKLKSPFLKFLFILISVMIFLIIFMSGSRSGLIAFILEIMLFGFFKFTKLGILKTTLIGILFLFSSFLLPFLQKDVVYENRAEIWQSAVFSGYQHPFLGWGFGNTEVALKQYNKKLYNRLQGYYVDSAHNIFLDYWIQGGFVGLSIFILLIYSSIKNFITKKSMMNITLLLGLLVTLSFNPASIVGLIGFWYVLGQGLFPD